MISAKDRLAIAELEAKLDAEYRAEVRAKHRREYPESVLSEPGETDGPNSYPVPWMWTDIYRYAPSELSLLAGEGTDDPDGDEWYRDRTERWAHSVARPMPWKLRHLNKTKLEWSPTRRQRARAAAAAVVAR